MLVKCLQECSMIINNRNYPSEYTGIYTPEVRKALAKVDAERKTRDEAVQKEYAQRAEQVESASGGTLRETLNEKYAEAGAKVPIKWVRFIPESLTRQMVGNPFVNAVLSPFEQVASNLKGYEHHQNNILQKVSNLRKMLYLRNTLTAI